MNVRVDPHSNTPPSQQLVAAMLDAMATGELGVGDKLPSVRGLAASALVNPNTVTKAYRDLEHLGATEGRNGSGVYVAAGGPEVAKAIRLAETLATFRAAALHALRSGHDGEVLRQALGSAVGSALAAAAEQRAESVGNERVGERSKA